MPLYTFICDECGKLFERRIAIKDHNLPVSCPDGHTQVRRIYSAPIVVFKGNGWYSTDHRQGSIR